MLSVHLCFTDYTCLLNGVDLIISKSDPSGDHTSSFMTNPRFHFTARTGQFSLQGLGKFYISRQLTLVLVLAILHTLSSAGKSSAFMKAVLAII